MNFTPWRSLGKKTGFTERSLAETLDGGQSFLWQKTRVGSWLGKWESNLVELRLTCGFLQWRTSVLRPVARQEIVRYLSIGNNYSVACDSLPWRSDHVLRKAMQSFQGLRILRQPLAETLFCFLLSSVKSIPQIKELCSLSAEAFGEEILPGFHAMPTWERLVDVPESDLRNLKFGYRAKYVAATAEHLSREPEFLADCLEMPYAEARLKLMELPGVGGKVADCALLFGANKLNAFPVDTWIAKVMRELYRLPDLSLDQMASFGRIHFGRDAGLAQQFLFSFARENRVGDSS